MNKNRESNSTLRKTNGTAATANSKVTSVRSEPRAEPMSVHPVSVSAKNFDRLYHEVAFYNPGNRNPDQMANLILDTYFEIIERFR